MGRIWCFACCQEKHHASSYEEFKITFEFSSQHMHFFPPQETYFNFLDQVLFSTVSNTTTNFQTFLLFRYAEFGIFQIPNNLGEGGGPMSNRQRLSFELRTGKEPKERCYWGRAISELGLLLRLCHGAILSVHQSVNSHLLKKTTNQTEKQTESIILTSCPL